ncbi:MAG: T9SS type A sorting domain-containing protein [Bacteroidales bacterium]|nr:T9SS type A sorting domain-containing protein [Bacteroidales bacterium]MCF8405275.1 T9SS type A sorting domain-containing protein [Bacteroidales bacterium]
MKKLIILQIAMLLSSTIIFAQWIPINSGLPDYPPTSMCNWVDTIVVSSYGGGIFLTYDKGENWTEMPGTLPNLFVNKIEYSGGQFDPISVSTDGGPYVCVNGSYIDCNGTGLTNNDINWWGAGNEGITGDAVVGTKSNGTFAANYTSPFIYDWYPASTGLSGNALTINDGLVGEGVATIATNGGMYQALGAATEWSPINDGLSGDALVVHDIFWLGVTLLATDGGLYYTLNLGSEWLPIIADEKFNVVVYFNTSISPSGYMVYALGEKGFYTQDFENWVQLDFSGIDGEVTAACADEENLYIGFTTESKDGKLNGGIYKRPLIEFLVDIENNNEPISGAVLEQNFPNPFNYNTQIAFSLSHQSLVCIKVYDILGKEFLTLINEVKEAGRHVYKLNSKELDPGTYFYNLLVDNKQIETRKMIVK